MASPFHAAKPYSVMSPKQSTVPDDMWVNVVWMPHSSLSQTSHVTLAIRSAHLVRDRLKASVQWRVRISVRGTGGLELVSVSSSTPAAAMEHRHLVRPTVANSTHEFVWNHVIQAPIRWKDLPRDAYLQLEIIGQGDKILYETTLSVFDTYGKMKTGLQRIEMSLPGKDDNCLNPGLEQLSSDKYWTKFGKPLYYPS